MQPSTHRSAAPHGIQWYFTNSRELPFARHDHFRILQRRCNALLGTHPALTRNNLLDRLEAAPVTLSSFLDTMTQLAILWRQLALVREHHTLRLAEEVQHGAYLFMPIAVCFDAEGVPWCPPLPESGLGDPYALSERLHEYWGHWQKAFPELQDHHYAIRQAHVGTRSLCDFLDQYYNAADISTSIGTMVAIESAMSTDCWERLRRAAESACQREGRNQPMPGFLYTSEAHARLQARHALHLLEVYSHAGRIVEAEFFRAAKACLLKLSDFEQSQAQCLEALKH